jgi:hypothetical protein
VVTSLRDFLWGNLWRKRTPWGIVRRSKEQEESINPGEGEENLGRMKHDINVKPVVIIIEEVPAGYDIHYVSIETGRLLKFEDILMKIYV